MTQVFTQFKRKLASKDKKKKKNEHLFCAITDNWILMIWELVCLSWRWAFDRFMKSSWFCYASLVHQEKGLCQDTYERKWVCVCARVRVKKQCPLGKCHSLTLLCVCVRAWAEAVLSWVCIEHMFWEPTHTPEADAGRYLSPVEVN